jgi:hypothetical protein
MLNREGKAGAVTASKQVRFSMSASAPDRANRMNDMLGRKPISSRYLRMPGLTATQGPTLSKQLRTRRPMDRTIHAASSQQRFVRSVYNRIDLKLRDVTLNNRDSVFG